MTDWQRLDAGKVSIGKKRDSHWHPPREHDQASKCRHKRHNCLQTAEEERTYVLQLCSKRYITALCEGAGLLDGRGTTAQPHSCRDYSKMCNTKHCCSNYATDLTHMQNEHLS